MDRNEELSHSLLRPIARKAVKDVTLDFAELYDLPRAATRLTEFQNSILPNLSVEERILLVKALLARFADLHEIQVAHRDVSDHSIWIERPANLKISGFPSAYMPELKTVGGYKEDVRVEALLTPEEVSQAKGATPYHRDVYLLGLIGHVLVFGRKPISQNGILQVNATEGVSRDLQAFFNQAFTHNLTERYANARVMLEAFNRASADETAPEVDPTFFAGFSAQTKEKDYVETEVFAETDEYIFYRSGKAKDARLVKIWFSAEQDKQKPDIAVQLLAFLQRCRSLLGLRLNGVQKVSDYGFSRGSLLLVNRWVEGQSLKDWQQHNKDCSLRITIASSLVETLSKLHSLEIYHGDVHPGNIVVDMDNQPVYVDILDYAVHRDAAVTTAYLPADYASLSPSERDTYGLAKTLTELFTDISEPSAPVQTKAKKVVAELENILNDKSHSVSLAPLKEVLSSPIDESILETIPVFRVDIGRYRSNEFGSEELLQDNGKFLVNVEIDRKIEDGFIFWVIGPNIELRLSWDRRNQKSRLLGLKRISQPDFFRVQRRAVGKISCRIFPTTDEKDGCDELFLYTLKNKEILTKVKRLSIGRKKDALDERPPVGEIVGKSHQEPQTSAVIEARDWWRQQLVAEDGALPTLEIAGDYRTSQKWSDQIIVPCHLDKVIIDYDKSDKVQAQSKNRKGDWMRCGDLSLRDSILDANPEIAIDNPHPHSNLAVGESLRLISKMEKASLVRRQDAVEKILSNDAVIPNLIDYFEPAPVADISPVSYEGPSEEDLDEYTFGDVSLNEGQRLAFKQVVSKGPISLLQGPPGTGKTFFVACLIDYLLSKCGVRRILLVSQSHEAVNNALEKGRELSDFFGKRFHAVRLGNESAVSVSIQHLHSASIEQSYREAFKAEKKERLVQVAATLGLPADFAAEYYDFHQQLVTLSEKIQALNNRLELEEDSREGNLRARVNSLIGTFHSIARARFKSSPLAEVRRQCDEIEESLIAAHAVRSKDAIERYRKSLKLAEEWLDSLGSPDANFAEFLARTREIVAGTLVGIGYRGTAVTSNRYDWVIVDEAARATSSELAVAIQAGQRVLLVGDHRQLLPTIPQEAKELLRVRYGESLPEGTIVSDFENIFNSQYGADVSCGLNVQYRMAPAIGKLVSDCFYEQSLNTERSECPEYYELLPSDLGKQLSWIDLDDLKSSAHEKKSTDTKSISNTGESRVILGLLRTILEADSFIEFLEDDLSGNEPPIGIICMYSKQRQVIEQMKAEATWLGRFRHLIKVDTVDSYQGKENQIVILSTVRNNPQMEAGFLRNENRINVAISRAMERLYIVGSGAMWRGGNKELPLGRVFSRLSEMAVSGEASILSAQRFLES